jgi:hypothetical protein
LQGPRCPKKKPHKSYTKKPLHPTNYGIWTATELKRHLGDRGLKKTGNKAELVRRIEEANELQQELNSGRMIRVSEGNSMESAIVL